MRLFSYCFLTICFLSILLTGVGIAKADDVLTWTQGDAPIVLNGGDDTYNPNYYSGQSREDGFDTGDLLRLNGDGLTIGMTGWNAGYAYKPPGGPHRGVQFSNIEQVYGTSGPDLFRAGKVAEPGPDFDGTIRGVNFFGGAGDDNIIGSPFGDFLDPGDGDDLVKGGAGSDHVDASRGDDTVYGGPGMDNIRWGGGDTTWMAPGNDFLRGGEDWDVVNLWAHYGNGDNGAPGVVVSILTVRPDGAMNGLASVQTDTAGSTDTVTFIGFELVWTHQGHDNFDASAADVQGDMGVNYNGRWGNDVLVGSSGPDMLEGGPGRDTITGGRGDDTIALEGDGDLDTIIVNPGDGADRVTGWDVGLDHIETGGRAVTTSVTDEGILMDFGNGDTVLIVSLNEGSDQ